MKTLKTHVKIYLLDNYFKKGGNYNKKILDKQISQIFFTTLSSVHSCCRNLSKRVCSPYKTSKSPPAAYLFTKLKGGGTYLIKLNKGYFIAFILLFIIETIIALFIHDTLIRPFVGDIFIIILLYCFTKSFINKKIVLLPFYLFCFAVVIEVLQYFHFAEKLHLENNTILRIILGSVFDWKDILCYFIGMIILFIWQSKVDF